jgi:hypothetical protein
MRREDEVRNRLQEARKVLSSATDDLSRGQLESFDFTTIAGRVGIIQALEWVLGETDELSLEVNPLKKPLDEI